MKKFVCILFAAMLALSLTACGADSNTGLSGTVTTDGSTSMERVIGALAEQFENDNSGVTVSYSPTGSGTGISAVAEGRADIGLSSRALKDSEIKLGLVGTVLAYDGIALIINNENMVDDLTVAQIAAIYTGEITNWSEVGGEDLQIVLIGRDAGSGTRGAFEELLEVEDACQYRQELGSNGEVITAVASNPGAVGYASISALKDTVKAVKVDGVMPDEETVQSGAYAIQRPFVLVTKEGVELSEAAQAFFDYITSEAAHEIITAAGVVPAA